MGSQSSSQCEKQCLPIEPKAIQKQQENQVDLVLKQIKQMNKTENLSLKASQSSIMTNTKNELKVKKAKDICSGQHIKNYQTAKPQIKDIGKQNNQEIEEVIVHKKPIRQLNPLNSKKLASDRALISQHSKTQNVLSLIPLQNIENKVDLQSRSKRCRVSRML